MAVTDHLAAFAVVLGIIFSFSRRRFTVLASVLGIIGGCVLFGVRMYDPRGMNLLLIWINRWLIVSTAGLGILSVIVLVAASFFRGKFTWLAGW